MTDIHTPGIAEPHQSVVAAIRQAVGEGWFSTADANALIDRLRESNTSAATHRAP